MSKLRPSHVELMQREYLDLARQRDAALREYDRRLLELQAALDRAEAPRLGEGRCEAGPRKDALDLLPLAADEAPEFAAVEAAEAMPEDWRLRSIWALSRLGSVLAMLSQRETKNPRLKAAVLRLAFGFEDAPSGREVAAQFGVTPERVSQLLERMQRRFCLPKNHNNKSAAAVSSYRALANEGKNVA